MSRTLYALALASGLAACTKPLAPRDYDPGTPCAQCKMLIDRRETVSQTIDEHGNTAYFDDLRCLFAALANDQGRLARSEVYVTDHDRLVWMRATEARFCESTEATPMASGLLAYSGARPVACSGDEVQDFAQARAAFGAAGATQ